MRFLAVFALVVMAACDVATVPTAGAPPGPEVTRVQGGSASFRAVVDRVIPVAEQECRARTRNRPCTFTVVVDERPNVPPNAFQTLDRRGRPVIGFTQALIEDARNPDEIAFVLGHEAAHHIEGHIPETQQRAVEGAIVGTVLAATLGLDAAGTEAAQRVGGSIGARRYAKEFELEADALGTVIAARAGFDPLRGAAFFNRIPDPGDQFLGTHPPNAERIATVRRVAAGL
ncbi:MAG: M48 family metalloprotease [Pseudomonadota bacterium]